MFAPVYFFLLPSVCLLKDISVRQHLTQNIDWLGNTLFIGAISSFVMAITFGGTLYSWNLVSEIILWVDAGVLMLAFGFSEAFHPLVVDASQKLYPSRFLRQPVIMMLQCSTFMSVAGLLVCLAFEQMKRGGALD